MLKVTRRTSKGRRSVTEDSSVTNRPGNGRRSVTEDSSVTRRPGNGRRSITETYDTDSTMTDQTRTVWTGGHTRHETDDDRSSDVAMSVNPVEDLCIVFIV